MSDIQPPLTRLVQSIAGIRREVPSLPLASVLEMAFQEAVVVLVDGIGDGEQTELDNALRSWLINTRPPSGAFGQSMENTMAYDSTLRLRAAAAKHLNERGS